MTTEAAIGFNPAGRLTTSTLDHLDDVDFIHEVGPFSPTVARLAGVADVLA